MDLEQILVILAMIIGGITGFLLVKFIQKKINKK